MIHQVVAEFFPEDGAMGAAFGLCGDFNDICWEAAGKAGIEIQLEGVYMTLDESDCEFEPPVGVTMEQLEGWGVISNLSHCWVIHDGRHYDAITPDGVDTPFDLRLFRQVCVEIMRDQAPQQLDYLTSEHAWWAESVRLTDEFLQWDTERRAALQQPNQKHSADGLEP